MKNNPSTSLRVTQDKRGYGPKIRDAELFSNAALDFQIIKILSHDPRQRVSLIGVEDGSLLKGIKHTSLKNVRVSD